MSRALIAILSAVLAAAAATTIILFFGLLPPIPVSSAQQQPQPEPNPEPKPAQSTGVEGPWRVTAGEGGFVRYNSQTGESFVMRPYLEGKGRYWLAVQDDIAWQSRMHYLLLQKHFSPEFVEAFQLPGGKRGVRLKETYRDPGFGFLPGDVITSIDGGNFQSDNAERAVAYLVSTRSKWGEVVSVTVVRNGKEEFLRVWPRMLSLEP